MKIIYLDGDSEEFAIEPELFLLQKLSTKEKKKKYSNQLSNSKINKE